ncbi:MAG TPA: DUF427 domain-containing protein [Dehalococcoidia bacterium]|nr:DUF427 domain-containing protein [Dehalococcoidia bacterium]
MATWYELRQTGYGFEESPRRIRTLLGATVVADSQRMRLLHPPGGRPPFYYFPESDIRTDLLKPSGHAETHADLGPGSYWDVSASGKTAEHAAKAYRQPPAVLSDLAGFVTFDWNSMDAWFEEDEEIFVHPRDPYHRVDVRESSRHIRVEIAGQTVADTQRPRLLFETNHPTRYYIPLLDVRLDLLSPSDRRTGCAYKGYCSYWSAGAGTEDIAWGYAFPFAECAKIANYVCFYNERVDIYADGALQERPAMRPPRPT